MKTFLKIPIKYWMISILIIAIPVLTQTIFQNQVEKILDQETAELIWLFTLLPSILFCYYTGLRGGALMSAIALTINLVNEVIEAVQQRYVPIYDVKVTTVSIILHILIVLSVGILSNKLKAQKKELKRLNSELERLSITDELTGLKNRRGFFNLSHEGLEKFPESALLYIDLNNFKDINDKYGHSTGNKLLQEVANRLNICVHRRDDIVGRIGGDEFVCLLPNTKEVEAKEIEANVRLAISSPVSISGFQLGISASIGRAVSPEDGETFEELLENADFAMYGEKRKKIRKSEGTIHVGSFFSLCS